MKRSQFARLYRSEVIGMKNSRIRTRYGIYDCFFFFYYYYYCIFILCFPSVICESS